MPFMSPFHELFKVKSLINYIDPRAPLTNFNDGRSDRGSYFIPKKITPSEFVYPKKSLHFLAYHKKSLSFFSIPQKNAGIFHRPKKSLLAKISDPKKSLGPSVIKICGGAPGILTMEDNSIINYSYMRRLVS